MTTMHGCQVLASSILKSGGYRETEGLPLVRKVTPAEVQLFDCSVDAVVNVDGNHCKALLSDYWYILHIYMCYILIFNRDSFPQIHKFFAGKPASLPVRLLRSFIEEDGERLYMSPQIEDFIASGKNFEHSGAAVHQTPLELLFWIKKKWEDETASYKLVNNSEVHTHIHV